MNTKNHQNIQKKNNANKKQSKERASNVKTDVGHNCFGKRGSFTPAFCQGEGSILLPEQVLEEACHRALVAPGQRGSVCKRTVHHEPIRRHSGLRRSRARGMQKRAHSEDPRGSVRARAGVRGACGGRGSVRHERGALRVNE